MKVGPLLKKRIVERIQKPRTVFIPISDMGAYEEWDTKDGKYQVYDEGGIHVHSDTETYFKVHVKKFESMSA